MMRGLLDFIKSGAKASVTTEGETALVSKASLKTDREKSIGQIPALLISTSRWLCLDLTSSTAAVMEESEVISNWTREMDPAGFEACMEASAFWPFSSERLPIMIWKLDCAAKSWQAARPMPLLPPVTRTVIFAVDILIAYLNLRGRCISQGEEVHASLFASATNRCVIYRYLFLVWHVVVTSICEDTLTPRGTKSG